MSVAAVERDALGESLTPTERIVCGIAVGIGAAGHAALAAAVALVVYAAVVGL